MKKICLSLVGMFVTTHAFADPQTARTLSQPNSKCVVKSTAGEYPTYTVYRNKKVLYSPKSDGIVTTIISPSGKYVALSAGEISLLDIEKGKFEYGVVIVNCESGKIKGYRKGQPTLISKWEGEQVLGLSDSKSISVNSGESLP